MSDQPPQAPRPTGLPFGEDIHRMVAQLRLAGAAVSLSLAGVVIAAVVLLVVRISRPVAGSFSTVVVAGVIALAALVGGLVAIELTGRRAKKADTLEAAAAGYKLGCLLSGGLNLAAACVTLVVLATAGVSRGLWVPQLLVLAVNVLGLILAVPRVKHLRALHYRPILPLTRV